MTDSYPPFRMDLGGTDPGSLRAGPLPTAPLGSASAASRAAGSPAASAGGAPQHRWTAGRVVSLLLGALLLLTSTGLLAAGGGLLWADQADQAEREDGWVTSPADSVSTAGYALVTGDVTLDAVGTDRAVDNLIGRVRLQVTSTEPGVELFAGIAPSGEVRGYLAGVGQRQLGDIGPGAGGTGMGSSGGMGMGTGSVTDVPGGPPGTPPVEQDIWVAEVVGSGTQTLEWIPTAGDWTVVVLRADGSADVTTTLAVAATVPRLAEAAWGLLACGAGLLIAGSLLVAFALRAAPAPGAPPVPPWSAPPPSVGRGALPPGATDDGPVLAGTSGGTG
jgi:hypothetical protein